MDLGISGKLALVTGAGRGLGRAVALQLARHGARVVVVSRTAADLARVVEAMDEHGAGHSAIALDLTADGAAETLVTRMKEAGAASPDIVVHNLGGSLGVSDALYGLADWRRVARLNLEVALELNGLLIPAMQARGWGRVVHVSSAAAVNPGGAAAYGVAKASLNAYVERLGRAVAASGVVVTAVLPGAMLYPGSEWERRNRDDPEGIKRYLSQRVAAGRFTSPEEVSTFIAFVCSEHGSYFAAALLPITGGAR